MGTKTVLNELLAFLDMAKLPAGSLDARSSLIMTYALTSFANFGSLGILIGGLGILAAGASFRIWAVLTLGRFFTPQVTIQEGHRVVQNGPYRFLRHPSYTGGLIGLLGLAVALGSWLGVLAVVLLPLAGILVRIHVEEAVLLAALGAEYREYAARTSRLVPGLW